MFNAMKKFIVTVKWSDKKESKYVAPSCASTPEMALFHVALTWHYDFLYKSGDILRPRRQLESVTVAEEPLNDFSISASAGERQA